MYNSSKLVAAASVLALAASYHLELDRAFALESAASDSSIKFSRTVSHVAEGFSGKAVFDHGCSGSDAYGSNDCAWNWGDSVKVTASAAAGADVAAGSKIVVDLKVDSIVPFKVTCPACGANCTATVPIVKQEITVALPPCPLIAAAKPLSVDYTLALPSSSPLPVKVTAKGSVSLQDAAGHTLATVTVDATVE